MADERVQKTVVLGVSGCIAAYKACEILRGLQKAGVRVKVLMTEHATQFVGTATFRALSHEEVAVSNFDDPNDPIPHISVAHEADVMLLAPLTANAMAKIAHGLADDLFSTTVLATQAPLVIAPAMNVGMWQAAATQDNLKILRDRGAIVVGPASGYLACGDVAAGKLADVDEIVARTLEVLDRKEVLKGKRVVVTAGPTQEPIDAVRYIANRSSGKMGYEIARAAHAWGADVTLVSGPTALEPPYGVDVVRATTAADMLEKTRAAFADADLLVCAAAVADYTPAHPADHKLKKTVERLDVLELVETADILQTLSSEKGNRVVIGFAAETNNVAEYARQKLRRKGCDAIVANDVSHPESTFGSDTNRVSWITAEGEEELPLASKREVAHMIIERATRLLS